MKVISDNRYLILDFINRCGLVTLQQLRRVFDSMTRQNLYLARKQLLDLDFIEEYKISVNKIYGITNKGAKFCNTHMKGVSLNSILINHTLVMNEFLIKEIEKHKHKEDFYFETERDILQNIYNSISEYTDLKDVKDKIPDFIIGFGNKKVAFEIELSRKRHKRLTKKLTSYFEDILKEKYIKVNYLCNNLDVFNAVNICLDEVYQEFKSNFSDNDEDLLTIDIVRKSINVELINSK
ncbi:hypothetical protein [Staphylococcus aureus]|uniref:hypothetical protein n=1 Tax=Staphylococcus aureus TaxID=1280 RepID=UPI002112E237|nr:hypothetical protein [Staphylococcus aureus]MCQ6827887.1 hypothetical protein [Staphylococcus aureus]